MNAQFDADTSLVPEGERTLVAVSSGADSLALLVWLHQLGRDIVVGHINHDLHELRQGDCDRDEAWVRNVCSTLGLRLEVRRLNLARKSGHVNEDAARQGRYEALCELAREIGASRVATAHTATDSLETALLNLLRGAGPRGLAGFSPLRVLSEGTEVQEAVFLIRPLWKVGRDELRETLRESGWTWREDPSNTSPVFRRNRVRHEVLPLLADVGLSPLDTLARSYVLNAQLSRDEMDFIESQAQQALLGLVKKRKENLLVLDGVAFRELPLALQRRVIRAATLVLKPDFRSLEGQKVELVRLAVVEGQKRIVWTWRRDFRVEWTGAGSGNRLRFWVV